MINTVSNIIIESVFFLKSDDSTGSSFTVTERGQQYLVSARHLFTKHNHGNEVTVELFHENAWKEITGTIFFHVKSAIDVCVIKLPYAIAREYEFAKDAQMYFGKDLFMLGFPYGLHQDSGELNRNFPFPFVKKGYFSAVNKTEEGGTVFFLDGHNNKGFSGGPVASYDPATRKNYIHGIISGYITQEGDIETPFGNWKYNENSGIVITYSISHVFEIIEQLNK